MPPHAALLFAAALLAGLLNAVAGGGSFISFPALLLAGIPPINANTTSTVALWPGNVASAFAYRKQLGASGSRNQIILLVLISLGGGYLGAQLLLRTPQGTFLKLVPWLLLLATVLFALGNALGDRITRFTGHSKRSRSHTLLFALLQFGVAIYMGYFGAGAGILMLALFTLMGIEHIHAMNALKTLLGATANSIALALFVIAHSIAWPEAILMIAGAIVGGYGGASFAQKIEPRLIRYVVIAIGAGLSAYFFWRT